MNLEERLKYCSICKNRKINREIGLICSLTKTKPNFDSTCTDFIKDEKEIDRKLQLELSAAGDIKTSKNSTPKYLVRLGIGAIILGILTFFLSIFWGGLFFISGILFIIKGENQKHILIRHKSFMRKVNNDTQE